MLILGKMQGTFARQKKIANRWANFSINIFKV
jgi:hypothetical protein